MAEVKIVCFHQVSVRDTVVRGLPHFLNSFDKLYFRLTFKKTRVVLQRLTEPNPKKRKSAGSDVEFFSEFDMEERNVRDRVPSQDIEKKLEEMTDNPILMRMSQEAGTP